METTATVEKKGACRKLLRIEVSAYDVKREMEKVFTEFSRKAAVPGFRKGKVPRDVIELRFASDVETEVLERLIPKALAENIKREELKVVGDPSLVGKPSVLPGEPLRFDVEVDLAPDFDVSSFRGIKVKKREVDVTDEDVTGAVEELRERGAKYSTVEDRSLKMGDYAIVDLDETVVGGKTLSRKNIPMEMSEERHIPGLCAAIAGLSIGEERDFTLCVPSDHPAEEIAGREVSFKVRVREIKEKVLPEIDDDFAQDLGDFKDLGDLRDSITKSIREQRDLEAIRDMETQVIAALVLNNVFDLPPSLEESYARRLFENSKERLRILGIKVEPGSDKEGKLRARSREDAGKGLRWLYIRNRIAENESISVSDEELEENLDEIAGRAKQSRARLRARLEEEGQLDDLRDRMKEEKVLSFLLREAKIK